MIYIHYNFDVGAKISNIQKLNYEKVISILITQNYHNGFASFLFYKINIAVFFSELNKNIGFQNV